ncbi:hypothetical protein [Streptomyces sp. NPDC002588]|uniref:hypothetical protein n=1 Tax=Streptomyces sp. NPDC002588 TaxID=3154419 RepID=UPI0033244ACD
MSETPAGTSELTSQYSAQVTGDLERNIKEQQRLSGDIEALQEQLAALRHDHSVLVSIQQALGVQAAASAAPVDSAAEAVTAVPAPRTRKTAASDTAKQTKAKQSKAKKPAAPVRKRTGGKSTAEASAAPSSSPKLVDLVHEHLVAQGEPRSAAEIATALGERHPERAIKTTVVRTTLEGLVAKNRAQRTKQGTSVFYTTPDSTGDAAEGEQTP